MLNSTIQSIQSAAPPPGFSKEELDSLFNAIPQAERQQIVSAVTARGPKSLRTAIPKGRGRILPGEYLERVTKAQKLGMQSFALLAGAQVERGQTMCIVGGGPSLKTSAYMLKKLVKHGAHVMAVNKSRDWCEKNGIPVHYAVLLDPKEWVADYIDLTIREQVQTRYLIASQCHEKTLNKFKNHPNAFLWHAAAGLGESKALADQFKGEDGHSWAVIPGPSVVGLRAVYLCHALAAQEMNLFGIDGSGLTKKVDDKTTGINLYAYDKPFIDQTWHDFTISTSTGYERKFVANHHMARSVYEFEDMVLFWDRQIREGKADPFRLKVHGDPDKSAIAFLAAAKFGIHADPKQNNRFVKRILNSIKWGF